MPAIAEIKPGTNVDVTVVKEPTNAAARKTIVRLLCKDRAAQNELKRQRKVRERHNEPNPRSGRIWLSRVVKQTPFQGTRGESGTIRATVDVLRDLASVERFVEVKPVRKKG